MIDVLVAVEASLESSSLLFARALASRVREQENQESSSLLHCVTVRQGLDWGKIWKRNGV
jgi:hypothetical protein